MKYDICKDLRSCVVEYKNEYYIILNVDVTGRLVCRTINGFMSGSSDCILINPLLNRVYKTNIRVFGPDIVTRNEKLLITGLISNSSYPDVWKMQGYRDKNKFLLVIESIVGIRHIFYITSDCIYCSSIKGGHFIKEDNMIDRNSPLKGVKGFSNYSGMSWLREVEFYKIKNISPDPNYIEVLGRLFSYSFDNSIVRFKAIEDVVTEKELSICSIADGSRSVLIKLNMLKSELNSMSEKLEKCQLARKDIKDYFDYVYDKPTAYFSNREELADVCNVLILNGYADIVSSLIKYNGVRANFYLSDTESICILDGNGKSGYSVCRLMMVCVHSFCGKPMYYELRLYPLCESSSYRVVFTTKDYELCCTMLIYPYPNLILNNGISIRGYTDKYLMSIKDDYSTVSFRYKRYEGNNLKIVKCTYNKGTNEWVCPYKDDLGYLNTVLNSFDKIAGIKNIVSKHYCVYSINEDKVVMSDERVIFSSKSLKSLRRYLSSVTDKCLVVAYKYDKAVIKNVYSPSVSAERFIVASKISNNVSD